MPVPRSSLVQDSWTPTSSTAQEQQKRPQGIEIPEWTKNARGARPREPSLSAGRSGVGAMTEEELSLMAKAREAYLSLMAVPCTGCQYSIAGRWTERRWLPCPQGVALPDVLGTSDEAKMFGDVERARMLYNWLDEKTQGGGVHRVRGCLEKCPQHIEIPEWLKKVHAVLCEEEAAAA